MTTAAVMIRTHNLHKYYQRGEQVIAALDGVDLQIKTGEAVAIMGPSGSGKSTLLYLLGGLDVPTGGELEIAGRPIDSLNQEELAHFRQQTIGFVFQKFHLVPTMTALENVSLPGIFARYPAEYRLERAYKLLKMLGMADRIDHMPGQLSGGQQQRVAIARALFNDPPIIMADEPTGSLDSKTGKTVMRLLRALCDQRGKTIILVTHDPVIANYSDRIIYLRDGRVKHNRATRLSEQRHHE